METFERPFAFLHVPKTGGVSFAEMLLFDRAGALRGGRVRILDGDPRWI